MQLSVGGVLLMLQYFCKEANSDAASDITMSDIGKSKRIDS